MLYEKFCSDLHTKYHSVYPYSKESVVYYISLSSGLKNLLVHEFFCKWVSHACQNATQLDSSLMFSRVLFGWFLEALIISWGDKQVIVCYHTILSILLALFERMSENCHYIQRASDTPFLSLFLQHAIIRKESKKLSRKMGWRCKVWDSRRWYMPQVFLFHDAAKAGRGGRNWVDFVCGTQTPVASNTNSRLVTWQSGRWSCFSGSPWHNCRRKRKICPIVGINSVKRPQGSASCSVSGIGRRCFRWPSV